MGWDVAGLGNALIDALVSVEDDALIEELGLVRGTMHPVDHARWQEAYQRVRHLEVTFDSGGSCANSIAICGLLGARAIYCGQVGRDQMGEMYAARMEEACGEHALRYSDDGHTGKCLSISISGTDAERTMLTDLGTAITLPDVGEFAKVLQDTRIAHFTGYTFVDPSMRRVVMEAMRLAFDAGAVIPIDAADPFVVVEAREVLWHLLREYATMVFLNADEARMLTGHAPREAVQAIVDRAGVETVVKMGAQGSLVCRAGDWCRVGIRPVKAIDTTGAGDGYAGGFLYGLVQGWDIEKCAQFATSVAGHTVAQVGAVVKDRDLLAKALREVVEGRVQEVRGRIVRLVRLEGASGPLWGRWDGETIAVLAGSVARGFQETGERVGTDTARLLAPVTPTKIVAVGSNYPAHAVEMGKKVPEVPRLFLKPPSAVIGPGAPIRVPPVTERVDPEGELAVVIGTRLFRATPDEAIAGVLGYTCLNDVTCRDFQRQDGLFTRAKGFDTFCPIGPWVVTGIDPLDLEIRTVVNGEVRSRGRTSEMYFSLPVLLAFITEIMTLEPGDVVRTGTPPGVAPIHAGDRVAVDIEGIGVLENPVQDWEDRAP